MKNGMKVLALFLIISVVVFTGCANKEENNSTADKEKEQEKMMLEFWTYSPETNNIDGYAMNTIRETFDVDAEFRPTTNETAKEKLQLAIASNDVPDWWKNLPMADYDKLVEQGVVAEIPEEYFEKYAPNYLEWIKKSLGDDPFGYVRRDGKIYSMPDVWTLGEKGTVLGLRKDWLEAVGIEKEPETLEEFEAALTSFRNDDPDGNGKKDTYGMTGTAGSVTDLFSSIFGAFGVYPGIFVENDGEIVRGEIEPGAKEALTVLNRWYENELIDPEFIVNKQENVNDKVFESKVGAVQYFWWAFTPPEAFTDGSYYKELRKNTPEADWVLSGGPKGVNGLQGITQGHPLFSSGIQFGIQLEDEPEKLIKYLQIFDATSFDREMYEKINFGEEGVTYNKLPEGGIEFIPPYDEEAKQFEFGFGHYSVSGGLNDYEFQLEYMTQEDYKDIRAQAEGAGVGEYDILSPIEKPIYNDYQERLERLTLQTFIDMITGRKSIDEFDDFVKEWKELGGDQILEEGQQKYDEMLAGN